MTIAKRNPSATPSSDQVQFRGGENHSHPLPPVNFAKPAHPLRWHEAIHRHPDLARALCRGWSGPTPNRLARLYRDRLGREPYGGWPGQQLLYEAAEIAQLAEQLAAEHRANFRRGLVR
jgi:hypothetical protein